jgi:hypothetical protein
MLSQPSIVSFLAPSMRLSTSTSTSCWHSIQPTAEGPNGTLPTALSDFYGNISLETSKSIAWYHQTGDLHIATYDFAARRMNLAVGGVNQQGAYCPEGCPDPSAWRAYNRPYLAFALDDLWAGV